MTTEPQTFADLKILFLSALTAKQAADPLIGQAICELIDKIDLVYHGKYELTTFEFLFGRNLLEAYEQKESKMMIKLRKQI